MTQFKPAVKHEAKARIALVGPSGSGKTFTALRIAKGLGGKVAVIDTEHGSASKYADLFAFDVANLDTFAPKAYVEAITAAAAAGYDVLVIDSLSHEWMGPGGALEMVDAASARAKGNSYVAWRDVTPQHNKLIDAIIRSGCHIIATMRSKTEYVLEQQGNGKTTPRKVGMAPVQREGMDYEFDVVGELDLSHKLSVTKTRCPALDGVLITEPGEDVAATIREWLDGAPAPVAEPAPKRATPVEPVADDSAVVGDEETPPADEPNSWREEIAAAAEIGPAELLALLSRIDDEPHAQRRHASLLLWARSLADTGGPDDIKEGGLAVAAWPDDRASRGAVRQILADAYRRLQEEVDDAN